MNPLTLREAILRALAADPELRELLADLPEVLPDIPARPPEPAFLAQFPVPPLVSVIDRLVLILRPYRPHPPVYAEPAPRPGVRLDVLDAEISDAIDVEVLAAHVVESFRRGYREMGSVLRGAHDDGSLDRFRTATAVESPPGPAASSPPTIWYHGGRSYSADQVDQYVVTQEEDYILQAFLVTGVAMDTSELEKTSGATNVPRAIGRLRTRYGARFAPALRTPGDKCAGGYYIRVRAV